MSIFVFLFCLIPIGLALLPYILAALNAYATMLAEEERNELQRARTAAINDRIATNQALREARLARENNAIVLQDIKIETEKLKQKQLEQKLGMTSQEFKPDHYE